MRTRKTNLALLAGVVHGLFVVQEFADVDTFILSRTGQLVPVGHGSPTTIVFFVLPWVCAHATRAAWSIHPKNN